MADKIPVGGGGGKPYPAGGLITLISCRNRNVNFVEDIERHNEVDSQSGCIYTIRVQS